MCVQLKIISKLQRIFKNIILYICIFNFRNLSKKYQPKKNSKEEEEYRYVHDLLLGECALMEEWQSLGHRLGFDL